MGTIANVSLSDFLSFVLHLHMDFRNMDNSWFMVANFDFKCTPFGKIFLTVPITTVYFSKKCLLKCIEELRISSEARLEETMCQQICKIKPTRLNLSFRSWGIFFLNFDSTFQTFRVHPSSQSSSLSHFFDFYVPWSRSTYITEKGASIAFLI